MVVKLKRNASTEDIKKSILKLGKSVFLKRASRKKQIVALTFGKIFFNENKTPLEIQNDMRNEWS